MYQQHRRHLGQTCHTSFAGVECDPLACAGGVCIDAECSSATGTCVQTRKDFGTGAHLISACMHSPLVSTSPAVHLHSAIAMDKYPSPRLLLSTAL